jgi:hypothetical protein
MKLRLVFTILGPLTLSLLFAAHSPPAHAADVTVVGTPGVDGAPGTDGGPGGNAIAITPANTDSSNTAIATGGNGGSGGAGANGGVGGNAAATAATSAADATGTGFATATGTGGTVTIICPRNVAECFCNSH